MLLQASGQIAREARVMDRGVDFVDQDVNIKEVFHKFGLPSRSLGASGTTGN